MQIHDTAFIAPGAVVLGDVTIGHGAIVHGCKIGDNTMIGMGAILMNGCKIGKNCIIGAGALVTQNVEIPDNSLVVGNSGKVKRAVTGLSVGNIMRKLSRLFYHRDTLGFLLFF